MNRIEAAETLLQRGANPNSETLRKYTPLHIAADEGFTRAAKVLIESGANVNAIDGRNLAPLHYASVANRTEMVQLLLSCGADPNARGSYDADAQPLANSCATPLHVAALKGHDSVVSALLAGGAVVDTPDRDSSTPFHLAVVNNQASTVRIAS